MIQSAFSSARKWVPFRTDAAALVALAGLVAAVYREHLTGRSLFLGNFDRLNSFLNTLLVHVEGWNSGHFSAWDDSMFMGRNIFALPFTYPNALNRLVSIFPRSEFYWVAGYVSIGLLVLAGWSAYLFIRTWVGDRFAAFVGAALYQFSALAVLKVSQNDMSFAVLIQIPLLLWLVRGIQPDRWRWRFAGLCLVLTHLLFFCFLQKAAYALLLLGTYTCYLARSRRSWHLFAVVVAAGTTAVLAAFPRIYGIAQEMGQLQRQYSPGVEMHDFDSLYPWLNISTVDVLRWFHDGLFGRYFGERTALHNSINITEGMLMYTGTLVPFILLAGLIRWNGRWLGVFRRGQGETRLFYGVIAFVFAVMVSKNVYHFLFDLFLRLDFTHSRIVIAGLPLICALLAARLAQFRPTLPSGPWQRRAAQAVAAAIIAIGLQTFLEKWSNRHALGRPLPLTNSWADLGKLLLAAAKRLTGGTPTPWINQGGVVWAWLQPAALGQILFSAALAALFFGLLGLVRRRPEWRWTLYLSLGMLLVAGSWSFADFQVNGAQVHTLRPFADSNSYSAAPDEFQLPTDRALDLIHERLESNDYRTVLYANTEQLPLFAEPHLGAMWALRQVGGYSSGLPQRLAALPWPPGPLGLRTLTFGSVAKPNDLPWKILAFLNVKYALRPSQALYKNRPDSSGLPPLDLAESPIPVVPRVFFAHRARTVPDLETARRSIVFGSGTDAQLIDPVAETIAETPLPLSGLDGDGTIRAVFTGDVIALDLTPSTLPRVLVLNELYHPDWTAKANGQKLTVFPANVVMRGILVPPGADHIEMDFAPFCRTRNVLLFLSAALAFSLLAAQRLCRARPRVPGIC